MSRRTRKSGERREPVVDTPMPRGSRAAPEAPSRSDDMSGGRKRARGRSPLRRFFYWCAVLGLWALIVCGGAIVWVAANLPPIHSLEIPRRPPSIEIVASDGKVLATRGEMHG